MALRRAIAIDDLGLGSLEIPDTDTALFGNIAPASGALTLGGSAGSQNVNIVAGHDLNMTGASDFTMAGTGALQISSVGTHQILGGTLDVNVSSDFSGNMQFSGGADLLGGVGSALSGFDSIEGILSGNLVDKSAAETITGQWTFQPAAGTNPKLIVKAAGGEPPDTLLFQVQTSAGSNLFSVDTEGDIVVAGGETVAGTTTYTGDVTLGDGGNTIQIGSNAGPPTGDNVYINTTGTANGQFSITTANFNVDTSGNQSMAGNLTLNDGGTITSTNNGDITIDANGTGVVNVTDNLNAQNGLDVTNAPLTANSGLTLTGTGITMTGLDVGTAVNRAGTGYFTTIDATNIIGTLAASGTNFNTWDINQDAVAGTDEDAGLIIEGGDGTNLQVWRAKSDTTAKTLAIQWKQDPTDPEDLNEVFTTTAVTFASTGQVTFPGNVDAQSGLDVSGAALTVDANGIDCAGSIDLNGILSFDGVGTIDTSGNNNLSISTGTANLLVTAGTVDLQTNVTTLDVPDQTGFSIGGTALTTTLWTATGVDAILGGPASNADAYHTHSSLAAKNVLTLDGLTTTGLTQYYATYVSANNTVSHTNANGGGGATFLTASFAGVYVGGSGEIVSNGKCLAQFDAGLSPAPVAGDPVILSWVTNGRFRNRPPAAGSGHYMTIVGNVLDASTYAGTAQCTIIIHPNQPVLR